jgi:hypothetical protein
VALGLLLQRISFHGNSGRPNIFPDFFQKKILNNKNTVLFYAHLNIIPNSDFLNKMYVITYKNTYQLPKKIISLDNPDKWNAILTPIFNISRHGKLGKKWRWNLENKIFDKFYNNRIVTRNNAMEKPVRFASNHHGKHDTDWLQEYFIPIDQLSKFIAVLHNVILENNVNLLNVTIRYVPEERNIFLTYAKHDCFSVVLYFNQDLASNKIEETQSWTQNLINASLSLNGNYYLPYQLFATIRQFQKGYPEYDRFTRIKNEYDPTGLFVNKLYLKYFHQQAEKIK